MFERTALTSFTAALVAGLGLAPTVSAAPLTITNYGYSTSPTSPITNNSTTVTSITTSAGTFSTLAGASSSANVTTAPDGVPGGDDIRNFWGSGSASSEVQGGAAVEGLSAATGLVSLLTGDFFFGTTLQGATGNANDIFILDFGSTDGYTVTPLGSAGTVIGTGFTFTPGSSVSSPTISTRLDPTANYDNAPTGTTVTTLNGFAFDVGDFTGLTGQVAGVRIAPSSGSSPDPAVVGYNLAAVPEPASLALLGLGGLMLLPRRRRNA